MAAGRAPFVNHVEKEKLGADIVMRDRDTKFITSFDAALKSAGFAGHDGLLPFGPTSSFVKRFIQSRQTSLTLRIRWPRAVQRMC